MSSVHGEPWIGEVRSIAVENGAGRVMRKRKSVVRKYAVVSSGLVL